MIGAIILFNFSYQQHFKLMKQLLNPTTLFDFIDNFRWMEIVCLASLPQFFFFKKVKGKQGEIAIH